MSGNAISRADRRANLLQWADALESGKYIQHRLALFPADPLNPEYLNLGCCIDIACQVLNPSLEREVREKRDEDFQSAAIQEVYNWFSDHLGFVGTFITLNDGQKRDFPSIAAFVRRNVEAILDYREGIILSKLNDQSLTEL